MTTESYSLAEFFEDIKTAAIGRLNEFGADQTPSTFFLLTDDGVVVIPCPWRNNDEKHAMVATVRSTAQGLKVRCYAFVTEMWMATIERDRSGDIDMTIVPSEHPDREEGLMIIAETPTERIGECYVIVRQADGTATLGRHMTGDFEHVSGLNLFPDKRHGNDASADRD